MSSKINSFPRPLIAQNICVLGMGYVGLHLSTQLAQAGFPVLGVDIYKEIYELLKRGISYIPDVEDAVLSDILNNKIFIPLLVDKDDYSKTPSRIKSLIADCDVFIICVPTPLEDNSKAKPNIEFIKGAVETIKYSYEVTRRKSKERLVVVESTTFPGCTEIYVVDSLNDVFPNIYFAYSPERIDPGRTTSADKPHKIIGASNKTAYDSTVNIYNKFYGNKIYNAGSIFAAELIKCIENSYRLMSISFSNKLAHSLDDRQLDLWKLIKLIEDRGITFRSLFLDYDLRGEYKSSEDMFYDILKHNDLHGEIAPFDSPNLIGFYVDQFYSISYSHYRDVDYMAAELERLFKHISLHFCYQLDKYCRDIASMTKETIKAQNVIQAMLTKTYGLNLCYPGPGAGGHCIPIDPVYLYWQAKNANIELSLIREAIEINDNCPQEIVNLLQKALLKKAIPIDSVSVSVLGISYKSNLPDIRETKAERLFELLSAKFAELSYCDPIFTQRQLVRFPNHSQSQLRNFGVRSLIKQPKEIGLDELKENIEGSNYTGVIIFCDHDEFSTQGIYEFLVQRDDILVVDSRNAIQTHLNRDYQNVYVLGRPTKAK